MNTQNYAVNIRVGLANAVRVNISQGDTGRTLAFSLYDGLSPFTPPTGSTVTIVGRKPSKLGFSETCTVSGNVATVATTLAMTQEAGKFPAELRIEAGGQSIGTANFTMYVEPSPHPDGTTDGTHATVDNLQTQIGNLANLTTTAKSDLVSAINEAAQSGGVVIDDTLTQTGQAADAKKTGDEISTIKADLGDLDDLDTTNKSSIVAAINEAAQSGGGGVSEDMALTLLGVLDVVVVDSASNYAEAYANFKRAWGLVYTYYSITYALSNVESTSDVTTIKEGLPYTTTLSADNQMTVSVTMGGVDVTATAYSNGVVTISEVTGNVVITASAAKDTTPKGTVNSFINTDGSVKAKTGAFATDAYEIKDGDDMIKYFASNATNGGTFSGSNKLVFYNGSGEYIAYFTTSYSNADPSTATPISRAISSGAATFRMTLHAVDIDKSYAYINNTGRVLFAGANTPYYGKEYITDL